MMVVVVEWNDGGGMEWNGMMVVVVEWNDGGGGGMVVVVEWNVVFGENRG